MKLAKTHIEAMKRINNTSFSFWSEYLNRDCSEFTSYIKRTVRLIKAGYIELKEIDEDGYGTLTLTLKGMEAIS